MRPAPPLNPVRTPAPVFGFLPGRLVLLVEQIVAQDQVVHFGAHEALVGVFRGADDGLAPDVEAGVDDEAAAGQLLEGPDQAPVRLVGLFVHRLDAGRVVHVGDGRHLGAQVVEPVKQLQVFVAGGRGWRFSSLTGATSSM